MKIEDLNIVTSEVSEPAYEYLIDNGYSENQARILAPVGVT